MFPSEFLWGTATSSFQVEGATHEDGRGESIWDRFCATPGRILDGSNGDVACDHYHRFESDIALMARLGVRAYRFSIAWPRIVPKGRGAVEQRGLDFYARLVDGLLRAGIEPVPTLYHWDLPQALDDEGGWLSRDTAPRFAEYAAIIGKLLGDRVEKLITLNEPWCSSILGYANGLHAPGKTDLGSALVASHHLLLAHGLAVSALRSSAARPVEVGITLNLNPIMPASPSEPDREEARRIDGAHNRWFLDPLFGRGYPADAVSDYIQRGALPHGPWPVVLPGDIETLGAPTDFLGINYYMRTIARSSVPDEQNLPPTEIIAPPSEWTDIGWEVYPDGLRQILIRVHKDYAPKKIYVTENGASYGASPDPEGRVRDLKRVRYLAEHFASAERAIHEGVPLAGYFVWSLLDNFEWSFGYEQRFGIVWVDYATQARTPKDSANYFARVIAQNAVVEP